MRVSASTVLDREAAPTEVVRSLGLHARSIEIMDLLRQLPTWFGAPAEAGGR